MGRVHTRVRRFEREHVLSAFTARVTPSSVGRPVTAFVSLAIDQSHDTRATEAVTLIPEVVELHMTTGDADFLAKVVARDTDDLRRVTTEIVRIEGVVRSSTSVSLAEVQPYAPSGLLRAIA